MSFTLSELREHAKNHGPMAVEWVTCEHCNTSFLAAHPFCESLECDNCGRRMPSRVAIYNENGYGGEPDAE
jgi:hypothetical protein